MLVCSMGFLLKTSRVYQITFIHNLIHVLLIMHDRAAAVNYFQKTNYICMYIVMI